MNEEPQSREPTRLAQLKALLAARGLRPRKALGQNFLLDPNFAAAIARAAGADERTLVLEAGPGTGFLTRALLDAHPAARVLAVEMDAGLVELLRDEFSADLAARRLTLLHGDALQGKHGLNAEFLRAAALICREESRPRRVLCANLAYSIATPLIANLALGHCGADLQVCTIRDPDLQIRATGGADLEVRATNGAAIKPAPARLVERIVATVQLELAERLFGKPGGADYGPLAVLLALCATGRIRRRVGPEVFWPRPRVSSAVVELDLPPWDRTVLRWDAVPGFQAFLQRLFQHRRKTLRAILRDALPATHALAKARAEDVPPGELLKLFQEAQRHARSA